MRDSINTLATINICLVIGETLRQLRNVCEVQHKLDTACSICILSRIMDMILQGMGRMVARP